MKDTYLKPESDVEQFKSADVITTSGNPGDDNDVKYDGPR